MNRTLEDMYNDLNFATENLKPLNEAAAKIRKEISALEDEIEKYKLDHAMYYPMSDLCKYKGRTISYIDVVEKDSDGNLSVERIYNDEYFHIDSDGHLDYSSYDYGVMSYDENIDKYVKYVHYHRIEYDYVGFMELVLDDLTEYKYSL